VGPRADLDAVVKRKILSPLPSLEPPIIQPVAQRYTTELNVLNYLLMRNASYRMRMGIQTRRWFIVKPASRFLNFNVMLR
jgi:hypothetical protein